MKYWKTYGNIGKKLIEILESGKLIEIVYQLSYKIFGKLIKILKKTNNKLHHISCGNLTSFS